MNGFTLKKLNRKLKSQINNYIYSKEKKIRLAIMMNRELNIDICSINIILKINI